MSSSPEQTYDMRAQRTSQMWPLWHVPQLHQRPATAVVSRYPRGGRDLIACSRPTDRSTGYDADWVIALAPALGAGT